MDRISSEPQPVGTARLERRGGRSTVFLSGACDLSTHPAVRDALSNARAGSSVEVFVDLDGVTFLAAGTVRLLLAAHEATEEAGVRFRVAGASGIVRRVLEACGAWDRLTGEGSGPKPQDRRRELDRLDRRWVRAEGRRATGQLARILAEQQQLQIDVEIRATRRRVLTEMRRSLRADPRALASAEFLALADRPLILDAILIAATSIAAHACDLQTYEPDTRSLRLVRQRGFPAEFLAYFAAIDATCPSACGTALTTKEPVLIDDITHSAIFAGQPTLKVMLNAGSRAVQSFPLLAQTGDILGVLSFHYSSRPPPSRSPELVARAAATALASS